MGTKLKSRTLSLILADILIIYGGILLALTLRLTYSGAVAYLVEDEGRVNVALATIICLIALYFYGLYDYIVLNSRSEMKLLLIQAIGSAWVVLAIVYYFLPSLEVGRGTALYSIGITLVGLIALRSSIHYVLGHPEFGEKILLVGEGKVVEDLARAVDLRRDAGYRIVGYTSNSATNGHSDMPMVRNLGADDDLENIVDANGVNRIIVGTRDRRGNFPVEPLLRLRLAGNVNIEDCSNFFERVTGQVHLESLRPSWLIFSEHTRDTTLSVIIRDSAHWLAALVGLIISLPVMAVTAILIKLESGGPVFYKQQRVGKNGSVFTLYKFRSMQVDAEADGKPVWARTSDGRVTFVGRIIRKIRVDEI
nr:sugar transferase [Blastocatellia bacterium]